MRNIEIKEDGGFGGMPKVSIDPTIRDAAGRYHKSAETHPNPPTMEHLEVAFAATREVLACLAPVLPYIEVVKIRFHLNGDDPNPVYLRCEVVIVEPITNEKSELGASVPVMEKKPRAFYPPINVKESIESLAGEIHEIVVQHGKRCAGRFPGLVATASKFHKAFDANA